MSPTPFLYSTPLHPSFHFVPHEFIHLFPLLSLSCTAFLSWPLSDPCLPCPVIAFYCFFSFSNNVPLHALSFSKEQDTFIVNVQAFFYFVLCLHPTAGTSLDDLLLFNARVMQSNQLLFTSSCRMEISLQGREDDKCNSLNMDLAWDTNSLEVVNTAWLRFYTFESKDG